MQRLTRGEFQRVREMGGANVASPRLRRHECVCCICVCI